MRALCLLATLAVAGAQELLFAYHGGELYAHLKNQFEDRGDHMLYFLYLVRHRAKDVSANMAHLAGDNWADTVDFALWRGPGMKLPRLLPDHDWTGWATAWIPPHDAIADVFTQEHVDWRHRNNNVYWTGAFSGGDVRKEFANCEHKYKNTFEADVKDWHVLRDAPPLPFTKDLLKPAVADLRHLTFHKYLIYLRGNSWSSSIKRILAAGAAVFLPTEVEHETMLDFVLRECDDCFYHYSQRDVCGSIARVFQNATDEEAHAKAWRLKKFVAEHLTLDKMLDLATEQINSLAAARPLGPVRVEGDVLTLEDGTALTRQTCAGLKEAHKSHILAGLHWQVDAWFDAECRPMAHAPYLSYVAL